MTERLRATIRGQVQGVGFRWFVRHQAFGLGLTGWVANEPDGSVRVVVEGPRMDLERLLAELHAGPPAASVEEVQTIWEPARDEFARFETRHGSHRGD